MIIQFSPSLAQENEPIIEDLVLSEKFLDALENCHPFIENKPNDIYEIKGLNEDGSCILVKTNNFSGMRTVSTCRLDNNYKAMLTNAQKKLQKLTSTKKIAYDNDYLLSKGIMMDAEICENHRLEYDPTKELRSHLENCSDYEMKDTLPNGSTITIKISEKEKDKCHFSHTIAMKALDDNSMRKIYDEEVYIEIKDKIKDITDTIECDFSKEETDKYVAMLKETIIPEGDAFDMDGITDKLDYNKRIINFLNNHPECQKSSSMKEKTYFKF